MLELAYTNVCTHARINSVEVLYTLKMDKLTVAKNIKRAVLTTNFGRMHPTLTLKMPATDKHVKVNYWYYHWYYHW